MNYTWERIRYCVTLENEDGKRLYMYFRGLKETQVRDYIKSDYPMLKIIKIEEMGKNGV